MQFCQNEKWIRWKLFDMPNGSLKIIHTVWVELSYVSVFYVFVVTRWFDGAFYLCVLQHSFHNNFFFFCWLFLYFIRVNLSHFPAIKIHFERFDLQYDMYVCVCVWQSLPEKDFIYFEFLLVLLSLYGRIYLQIEIGKAIWTTTPNNIGQIVGDISRMSKHRKISAIK